MITEYTSARVIRVAVLGALVATASIFSYWREHTVAPVSESRLTRWRGTVLDPRGGGDDGLRTYTFAIEHGPLALVSLRDQLQIGTVAIVRGRLEPLDAARNPGETSERAIESEHGISARIERATLLETLGFDNSWRARIAR
ncbi:MAG TPA: hypothetical protein VF741_04580, partial [Candidatus Aquilonibacter sp.]